MVEQPPTRRTALAHWLVLACAALAVAAYHMPWQTHKIAAFTNNAFDLAEWVSLHPTVRAERPALLTSLLLRLPLVTLAVIIALTAHRLTSEKLRWLWCGVAFLVVLRLNPPVEFYPWGGGSVNDRQLGYLMCGGLGAVLMVTLGARRLRSFWQPLTLIAWGVGAASALGGYARAEDVIAALQVETTPGAGLVLFVGFALAGCLTVFWSWNLPQALRQRRQQPNRL